MNYDATEQILQSVMYEDEVTGLCEEEEEDNEQMMQNCGTYSLASLVMMNPEGLHGIHMMSSSCSVLHVVHHSVEVKP